MPTSPESPKLDRAPSLSFSKRSEGQAPSGRMRPPPRIDSNAASKELHIDYEKTMRVLTYLDKPFKPLEPSPMSNYSDPRSRSPLLSPGATTKTCSSVTHSTVESRLCLSSISVQAKCNTSKCNTTATRKAGAFTSTTIC
jgi:hypothetical protein